MFKERLFTLIELLVVISIIAILLTLLMPSLSKAREQARRAVDVSCTAQLSRASLLYSNDNDKYFPERSSGADILHNLKASGIDMNETFINPYLGEGSRSEVMFCISSSSDVRGPDHEKYDGKSNTGSGSTGTWDYSTRQYYNMWDYPGYSDWVIPGEAADYKPDLRTVLRADSRMALWGCLTLNINDTKWLAHGKAIEGGSPDGAANSLVDGSASWYNYSQLQKCFTKQNNLNYYWPVPE